MSAPEGRHLYSSNTAGLPEYQHLKILYFSWAGQDLSLYKQHHNGFKIGINGQCQHNHCDFIFVGYQIMRNQSSNNLSGIDLFTLVITIFESPLKLIVLSRISEDWWHCRVSGEVPSFRPCLPYAESIFSSKFSFWWDHRPNKTLLGSPCKRRILRSRQCNPGSYDNQIPWNISIAETITMSKKIPTGDEEEASEYKVDDQWFFPSRYHQSRRVQTSVKWHPFLMVASLARLCFSGR